MRCDEACELAALRRWITTRIAPLLALCRARDPRAGLEAERFAAARVARIRRDDVPINRVHHTRAPAGWSWPAGT